MIRTNQNWNQHQHNLLGANRYHHYLVFCAGVSTTLITFINTKESRCGPDYFPCRLLKELANLRQHLSVLPRLGWNTSCMERSERGPNIQDGSNEWTIALLASLVFRASYPNTYCVLKSMPILIVTRLLPIWIMDCGRSIHKHSSYSASQTC